MTTAQSSPNPFATIRNLARAQAPAERCDLCGLGLPSEHPHLLELANRRLLCACNACAILFDGQHNPKYRRVPRRIQVLSEFRMTDEQWEGFHLPINLVFFYFNSAIQRVVAMYPSPAGATESLLNIETWKDLAMENPILLELEPDVEAMLINRMGQAREYCRVPIDECFKLVGLLRTHWRGLSGGAEVWREMDRFFARLKEQSTGTGGNGA